MDSNSITGRYFGAYHLIAMLVLVMAHIRLDKYDPGFLSWACLFVAFWGLGEFIFVTHRRKLHDIGL